MNHRGHGVGTALARWAGASFMAGWYYWPAVPSRSQGMSGRWGAVHQTDYATLSSFSWKGWETGAIGFCVYDKECWESTLLGRKVYLQVILIHSWVKSTDCFFWHKEAETCFLGKVRAGLSSCLVKTDLLAAVEVSGKVIVSLSFPLTETGVQLLFRIFQTIYSDSTQKRKIKSFWEDWAENSLIIPPVFTLTTYY